MKWVPDEDVPKMSSKGPEIHMGGMFGRIYIIAFWAHAIASNTWNVKQYVKYKKMGYDYLIITQTTRSNAGALKNTKFSKDL